MNSVGNLGALSPRSLVREGADFCEELVRRGGRALTIPFGQGRMVVSFQWLPAPRRRPEPTVAPELTDRELARLASRSSAPSEPAWDHSLVLQYGGHRRY